MLIRYRYRYILYRRYFFSIGIGIADTFEVDIGIDYQRYFLRVSLTTLATTRRGKLRWMCVAGRIGRATES